MASRAAEKVAAPETFEKRSDELSRSLVELQQARVQVDASAKTVSTRDQTLGALLDVTV